MIGGLSPADLRGPSGAAERSRRSSVTWAVGAQIGLAVLEASLAGDPVPAGEFNQGVWDRWNAMGPDEQAACLLTANEALVRLYESLDESTKTEAKVDLGWMPPLDVATLQNHHWQASD